MTFSEEYTKLALIGNGAFSTIWKVRHNKLRYVRAMKISKDDIESEDDTAYQTFLNECRLLLRVGNGCHPNIVRIYQPRFIENKAVVEMDYIQGETLCEYIKRVKFVQMDDFIQFFRQIVGALAYCHVDIYKFMMDAKADHIERDLQNAKNFVISPEKEAELIEKYGVVHNDLHSNNIMRRSYDGQYILLDFGLAIQDGHSIKSSSRADGAVEYKAPEKWDEKAYELTARTDVYGLGVLLFEMLTGRPPFPYQPEKFPNKEAAIYAVYNAHLHEEPPYIMLLRKQAFEQVYPDKKYVRDYPDWLEDMIRKCLAKDPADRYANAKEMLEEFERRIQNFTVQSESEDGAKIYQVEPSFYKEQKPKTSSEKKTSNWEKVKLFLFGFLPVLAIVGSFFLYKSCSAHNSKTSAVTADSLTNDSVRKNIKTGKDEIIIKGSIDNNIGFSMQLFIKDDEVKGTEHYDNQPPYKVCKILGEINGNGKMLLHEYESGKEVGHFSGILSDEVYSGTWSSSSNKSYSFSAKVMPMNESEKNYDNSMEGYFEFVKGREEFEVCLMMGFLFSYDDDNPESLADIKLLQLKNDSIDVIVRSIDKKGRRSEYSIGDYAYFVSTTNNFIEWERMYLNSDLYCDGYLKYDRGELRGLVTVYIYDPTDDDPENYSKFEEIELYLKKVDRKTASSNIPKKKGKSETSCFDNNHPHIIDLGLPSGTKWACCNLGASTPEDYGKYYAWGETKPKNVYDWDTYQYGNGWDDVEDIGSDIGSSKYDAATANWGSPWHMPSESQIGELLKNCASTWTTRNGVNGMKFTGTNGGSIFLPAAGDRFGSKFQRVGSGATYWSSTLSYMDCHPCCFTIDAGGAYWGSGWMRNTGESIRPVR